MTQPRVMNERCIESYKEFAIEKVREWHDKASPDYIILTETSATPFGWLFKEAWKAAYPNEKTPKFYRIDPRAIR